MIEDVLTTCQTLADPNAQAPTRALVPELSDALDAFAVQDGVFSATRHGATTLSQARKIAGGGQNIPLSEQGILHARQVSALPYFNRWRERVEESGQVFVSELTRTQETAAILAPGVRQTIVQGLNERDLGQDGGQDDANVRPRLYDFDYTPAQGEATEPYISRVVETLVDLFDAGNASGSDVHFVGHSLFMTTALASLLCLTQGRVRKNATWNGAIDSAEPLVLSLDERGCFRLDSLRHTKI